MFNENNDRPMEIKSGDYLRNIFNEDYKREKEGKLPEELSWLESDDIRDMLF